jgi:NitT/TauT family transport system substrate-binding protein
LPLTRSAIIAHFASGLAAAAFAAPAAAQSAEPVSIGVVGSTSEIPLFIADKLGYFRAEGIAPNYVTFDSASKMIAR